MAIFLSGCKVILNVCYLIFSDFIWRVFLLQCFPQLVCLSVLSVSLSRACSFGTEGANHLYKSLSRSHKQWHIIEWRAIITFIIIIIIALWLPLYLRVVAAALRYRIRANSVFWRNFKVTLTLFSHTVPASNCFFFYISWRKKKVDCISIFLHEADQHEPSDLMPLVINCFCRSCNP